MLSYILKKKKKKKRKEKMCIVGKGKKKKKKKKKRRFDALYSFCLNLNRLNSHNLISSHPRQLLFDLLFVFFNLQSWILLIVLPLNSVTKLIAWNRRKRRRTMAEMAISGAITAINKVPFLYKICSAGDRQNIEEVRNWLNTMIA